MSDLIKPVKPLEWKTMVLYHYGDDKDKKELIKNLKLCWKQANKNQQEAQRTSDAYDAMEALFSEFRESSMRIIIFSMRNRQVKRNGKEIGLDQFVDDSNLLGLKKCINEWNSQADSRPNKKVDTIKMMRRDSLTELILSHAEIRNKGEYMIAAIIQRVRRLRKATDQDLSKLSFGDSLLEQANTIWERQEDEIVERENCMVVPNKMINVAIDMQKLLNGNRKATTFGAKRIAKLDKQLDDYQKEIVKGTAQHTWYLIYKWWLLSMKLRRAQKRLDFVVAKKIGKKMKKLEGKMEQHSSYLDSLKPIQRGKDEPDGDKKGKKDEKDPYSRLQEYHNQLAKFMHNPTWENNNLAAKERKKVKWDKKSVDPEMLRNLEYAAFPGGTRLRRWKVHQFVDPKYLNPIELVSKNEMIKEEEEYSKKDWKENRRPNSLIQKCRVSISNSSLMTQNIIANNSHIAPATLILNAVDLMVRIRWFLATPKVHNMKKARTKNPHPWVRAKDGKSFRKDHELRISREIKDGLVLALSEIKRALDIYGAEGAHEAVKIWVKSLKDLPLETRDHGVGPLGQLCDHCGALLGWKWENPGKDRGRESDLYSEKDRIEIERKKLTRSDLVLDQNEWKKKARILEGKEEEHAALVVERNKIDDSIKKMKTCLLLKDSDGKELLRIDTANPNLNPYLKPIGEISSHS